MELCFYNKAQAVEWCLVNAIGACCVYVQLRAGHWMEGYRWTGKKLVTSCDPQPIRNI